MGGNFDCPVCKWKDIVTSEELKIKISNKVYQMAFCENCGNVYVHKIEVIEEKNDTK